MLVDGHRIPSELGRAQLWDELLRLENIARWSALERCASSGGDTLSPGASYLCTHDNGRLSSDASVEVTAFVPRRRLSLLTLTPVADVEEHLTLEDDGDGTVLVYSADATSAGFGPSTTIWLRLHVLRVCEKLEVFVRRSSDADGLRV